VSSNEFNGGRPPLNSNDRVERLQVGVLLREIAEGAIHLEADLEVRLGVEDVAEKRLVAPHVVIIDRLFQKRDRSGDQEFFCFGGFAQLMEAEAGMEKTGAGIGSDPAKSLADAKSERPFLFPHQVVQAKLKDLGAVLVAFVDGVEFGKGLACHAQLCVAAGGLQLPFELHGSLFSTSLAIGIYACL
jgi:hypothetical protein